VHYIIANNPKFDISKVAERLNEGDTVIHLNKHTKWEELRHYPIYSKCSHEIFFNIAMKGIRPYRRHPNAFSKVYWANQHRSRTVPYPYRGKRVSQLLKRGDSKAAVELYFKKESSAVTCVFYGSRSTLDVCMNLPQGRKWSGGHKALRYLLKSMEPHCIKLAGFSFHGCHGHPWDAEKKFSQRREIEIIN